MQQIALLSRRLLVVVLYIHGKRKGDRYADIFPLQWSLLTSWTDWVAVLFVVSSWDDLPHSFSIALRANIPKKILKWLSPWKTYVRLRLFRTNGTRILAKKSRKHTFQSDLLGLRSTSVPQFHSASDQLRVRERLIAKNNTTRKWALTTAFFGALQKWRHFQRLNLSITISQNITEDIKKILEVKRLNNLNRYVHWTETTVMLHLNASPNNLVKYILK